MAEIVVPDPTELVLKRLDLDTPAQVNRSVWTGGRKVVGLPGAERWTATAEITDLATENAERPWRAFLFAMRGVQNWFRLPLPCNNVTVNPVVGTGAMNARSIPVSGMPAGIVFLQPGAFLTIAMPSGAFRPVVLTQPLTSNASGVGIAYFEPALREVPVTGAAIYAVQPFMPAVRTESTVGLGWSNAVSGTSLDLEEPL